MHSYGLSGRFVLLPVLNVPPYDPGAIGFHGLLRKFLKVHDQVLY